MKFKNKILIFLILLSLILTGCGKSTSSVGEIKESQEEIQASREAIKKELAEQRKIPEYVMTKEIFKDKNGKVYGRVDYDYNEEGRLVKVSYFKKDGSLLENKRFEYDERGLRTKRIVTKAYNGRMSEEWRYQTYDRRELWEKTEEVWYMNSVGWPVWKEGTTTYEYNDLGQVVKYEEVKKDGTKERWGAIEYYSNGHRKHKWIEDSRGNRKEIDYNKSGQWTKKLILYDDGDKQIEEARYDEKGNEIEHSIVESSKNGKLIMDLAIITEYNAKNQLIKSILKNNKYNFASVMNYKYDEEGNEIEIIKIDKNGDIEKNILESIKMEKWFRL